MIHAKADLFEMKPTDHERMRAIARRQVRARIEHLAKPVAPQKDKIEAIEDAMIEGMTGDVKRTGPGDHALKWNQIKQVDAQAKILAAMDRPQTAMQIAKRLNKSGSNVVKILNKLRVDGRVTCFKRGGSVAGIWSRTDAAYAPPGEMLSPSEIKGEGTRAKVLSAMAGPMTAAEISEIVLRSHTHTLEVLRSLIERDLVTRYKVKGQHAYMFERVGA